MFIRLKRDSIGLLLGPDMLYDSETLTQVNCGTDEYVKVDEKRPYEIRPYTMRIFKRYA